MKRIWYALPLALALAGPGCDDGGGDSSGSPAQMGQGGAGGGASGGAGGAGGAPATARPEGRFTLEAEPAATRLGQIPFPHDLYRKPEGGLDLSGVRAVGVAGAVRSILDALEAHTEGFGTSAGFYLSFDGPVPLANLPPDSAASLEASASLFLVDIDPASPERGQRWPLNWRYEADETRYLPAHSLKIRLVEGFALRGATTYALIATDAIGAPSAHFSASLGPSEPTDAAAAAWRAHAPLRAWLAEQPAVRPSLAAVFTTQDPTTTLFKARDTLHTLEAPELVGETENRGEVQGLFEVIEGRYRAPRFQEGVIPYQQQGMGQLALDAEGRPVVQGHEELRFALSLPRPAPRPGAVGCDMPARGWPLVLYAHGTGGDFRSYITPRSKVAAVLAKECIAVLGMDQLHHGTRDGGACPPPGDSGRSACLQLLYFNFIVPVAGRDNQIQSALDLISLLRFAKTIDFPPELSHYDRPTRIDPERIMFMGHSQGGLNGPLFMAVEPEIRGGVLSGAGSTIAISIEQKVEPFDLNELITNFAGLRGEGLDRWHPTATLLQTFVEPGDSVNFARYWFAEPPAGYRPKSVFMTVGMTDNYTPADAGLALAAAGRVPVINPVVQAVEALELLGIESPVGVPPFSGNVAGGRASAGVAQFPNSGHFTIFDIPSAANRYGNFLRDLARFNAADPSEVPPPGIY